MQSIFRDLFRDHADYHVRYLDKRRLKKVQIMPLIDSLEDNDGFSVRVVGASFEERDIHLVSWGDGPIVLFMWSQMHGDESTATRALLDVFQFLKASDRFNEFREFLRARVRFHFLPILNPDGADCNARYTSQQIDMNRDAERLQTPEARVLKELCKELQPHFGFNLHDQSINYSAGETHNPAIVSFLAPAFDERKTINETRGHAMKLLGVLSSHVRELFPGCVGKYDDTFNARAFGDNIQKWGISTVLIESGGYFDDPEKELIRRLNFCLLLEAARCIGSGEYLQAKISDYQDIPFNQKDHFCDLLLRNAVIDRDGKSYKVDISIIREEIDLTNHLDFFVRGVVSDIGDLSHMAGYEELDLDGGRVLQGKFHPTAVETPSAVRKSDAESMILQGFTYLQMTSKPLKLPFVDLPIMFMRHEETKSPSPGPIEIGQNATFICRKEEKIIATIVNGYIVKKDLPNLGIRNGLIL